jgi:hypothetical protein
VLRPARRATLPIVHPLLVSMAASRGREHIAVRRLRPVRRSAALDLESTRRATRELGRKIMMETEKTGRGESPIACRLDPFSPAERARWHELGSRWRASVRQIRELPDGFALCIPAEAAVVMAVAEWMTLDRLCCPFFTFTLEIEREGGPAWLRLTGRAGTKEFLRRAAAGWLEAAAQEGSSSADVPNARARSST